MRIRTLAAAVILALAASARAEDRRAADWPDNLPADFRAFAAAPGPASVQSPLPAYPIPGAAWFPPVLADLTVLRREIEALMDPREKTDPPGRLLAAQDGAEKAVTALVEGAGQAQELWNAYRKGSPASTTARSLIRSTSHNSWRAEYALIDVDTAALLSLAKDDAAPESERTAAVAALESYYNARRAVLEFRLMHNRLYNQLMASRLPPGQVEAVYVQDLAELRTRSMELLSPLIALRYSGDPRIHAALDAIKSAVSHTRPSSAGR